MMGVQAAAGGVLLITVDGSAGRSLLSALEAAAPSGMFSVRIASTGKILTVPSGRTVVDVLAENGIEVPMSCQQGVCGTCVTRVLEGIPEHHDVFMTDEEHARNSYFDPALAEERLRALASVDIDVILQNKAAAARLAWTPRLHNPQLPHWLHRIDAPTLVVWGQEDRICPFPCHRTFVETIPGASLLALPRSGHALHTERPAEVAAGLNDFYAGLSG